MYSSKHVLLKLLQRDCAIYQVITTLLGNAKTNRPLSFPYYHVSPKVSPPLKVSPSGSRIVSQMGAWPADVGSAYGGGGERFLHPPLPFPQAIATWLLRTTEGAKREESKSVLPRIDFRSCPAAA